MKVLIIGSGGREHALAWKASKSQRVRNIYIAPGNAGTSELGENVNIPVDDIKALGDFALEKEIDLTIVGPELPLVLGIVDEFKERGLRIFGVDKECAQLEASKDFSKSFMEKYNIPTAKYRTYTDYDEAIKGLREFSYPLVIKADGLCAGKGVIISNDQETAEKTIDEILNQGIFGEEGKKIVIEEFLDGIESSLICFVTEGKILPMETARDYKKIFNGDQGPNTGGVGCYSPSNYFTDDLNRKIEKNILNNIRYGLENEGLDYRGILFIGLMIVDQEPYVLEFNVRMGDPEAQVLLVRLESEIVDLFQKTIDGTLNKEDINWTEDKSMTVILTSKGYPDGFNKGYEIKGLSDLDDDIVVFHSGTDFDGSKLVTSGGRVLAVTGLGENFEDLRSKLYKNIEKIDYEGISYRTDIGID